MSSRRPPDIIMLGPLRGPLQAMAGSEVERVAMLLGREPERGVVEVWAAFAVENIRRSPIEFEADPWQVVQASRAAEKYGLEIVAVYHTHTSCPPAPSRLDLEGMARWPYTWVIACPGDMKAWYRVDESLSEVRLG